MSSGVKYTSDSTRCSKEGGVWRATPTGKVLSLVSSSKECSTPTTSKGKQDAMPDAKVPANERKVMLCQECGEIITMNKLLIWQYCACGESEAVLLHGPSYTVGIRGRACVLTTGRMGFVNPDKITFTPADPKSVLRIKQGTRGKFIYYRLKKLHGR